MDNFLVQMAIVRGQPTLNRDKVKALTANLRPSNPTLVLLPELFSTGYVDVSALEPTEADVWTRVASEDCGFIANLASNLGCWVAGTTVEKGPADSKGKGGFRNLIVVYSPDGQEQARYQKIHPFSYGGEDRLFTRGNEMVTYAIDSGESWIVQPSICYDLRFPELYRAGSLRGAHLITVQANWPQARQLHWEALLRARAIENQAYVAGVNCTGDQDTLHFAGGSLLISPKGDILAQGGEEEELVRGTIDLDFCKQWRKQFPALGDRMSADFYRP